MIDFARARTWFAGEVMGGRANELVAAVVGGADVGALILGSPVGPLATEATQVLERALGIFERLGDRTGVMSTVIAMAYARYGPVMHLSSSARHLEEIRRVTSRLSELVTESERLASTSRCSSAFTCTPGRRSCRTWRFPAARMPIEQPAPG